MPDPQKHAFDKSLSNIRVGSIYETEIKSGRKKTFPYLFSGNESP